MLTTPAARTGRSQICAVLALDVSQLELLCSRVFPDVDPPPDRYGGRPPVPGWRRLAAVLAYLRLPRATLRRAGAVVGVGRSTVARALRELLPTLAGLGLTQPDGSVLQPADLHEWLAELAAGSELVLIDGTVTEIPRPALASTRRLFWNVKHACYSYQSLTVVTPAGDFLALTSGWPGKVHELDALDHAAFLPALVTSKVLTLADRGFRGAPARTGARFALPVGRWSKRHDLPETVQAYNYRQNSTRAGAEHGMAALNHWGILRFTRFSIVRFVDAARAVANIISLLRYGHRAAS